MTAKEYTKQLGSLVANLSALELVLRAFLYDSSKTRPLLRPNGTNIYSLPAGTELAENELTNYDSLGKLIRKFNTIAKLNELEEIDRRIIDIRDALAHGRISSSEFNGDMRLIKFSPPSKGKVKITFNEVLTELWFNDNIKLIYEAIIKVRNCPRNFKDKTIV